MGVKLVAYRPEGAVITPPENWGQRSERLQQLLADIEANPQHWNQCDWHCETSHCAAGFAQFRALGLPYDASADEGLYDTVEEDAQKYLGLAAAEANLLFHGDNGIDEIREYIVRLSAPWSMDTYSDLIDLVSD